MLAVLKRFGARTSGACWPFPSRVTLALDFPNLGQKTLALLDRLDEVTRQAGGAVYPAKDARMSGRQLPPLLPAVVHFCELHRPRFSSSFWRRVMAD